MNGGISLIVATRERPNNIIRFWQSFQKMITLPSEKLEVLFLVDNDDTMSSQTIMRVCDRTIVKTLLSPRKNVPVRINEAWSSVSNDIVGLFGDDIVFKSKGWDQHVLNAFLAWPDEIGVVYGKDGWQNEKLCTHPFLSRRWVETLGYVAHDGFFHYFVDTWTHDIAKRSGRLRYLSDLWFDHMHPDAKKAPIDVTRRSRAKFFQHDADVFATTINERSADVQKIKRVTGELA